MSNLVGRLRAGLTYEPSTSDGYSSIPKTGEAEILMDEAATQLEAKDKLIAELERRQAELNNEIGGLRRSYSDARRQIVALSSPKQEN